MFVDSHCHINFDAFAEDTDALIARMAEAQVSHAMCISVTLPEWPSVVALADRYENIYATAGVHPDYENIEEPTIAVLLDRATHPKVQAIGETGLDYYRLTGDLSWQRERFRTHIRAANICKKPLVIHTRNSSADTLKLMAEENADIASGVMHCFTETQAVADAAMEMGFYISLSGIVTFKSAKDLQALAKTIPLNRLLIETDSPYLAPTPHRGKMNQPGYVRHVAEFIATLRGVTVEEIAEATTANFYTLFSLKA